MKLIEHTTDSVINDDRGTVMLERISHCFEPVFDENSRVLILGTMPSPASRENGFYYSHKQNRFWRIMSTIFNEALPQTPQEKKALLLRNRIALWDVLKCCDIDGASDASIKNPIPNDISVILDNANIEIIIANGCKAYRLYNKYLQGVYKREAVLLPSTSPANARIKLDELIVLYGEALCPVKTDS